MTKYLMVADKVPQAKLLRLYYICVSGRVPISACIYVYICMHTHIYNYSCIISYTYIYIYIYMWYYVHLLVHMIRSQSLYRLYIYIYIHIYICICCCFSKGLNVIAYNKCIYVSKLGHIFVYLVVSERVSI